MIGEWTLPLPSASSQKKARKRIDFIHDDFDYFLFWRVDSKIRANGFSSI